MAPAGVSRLSTGIFGISLGSGGKPRECWTSGRSTDGLELAIVLLAQTWMTTREPTWRKTTRSICARHCVANVIPDTGPLVALFKRNDRHHPLAVDWFKRNKHRLLTTLPVVTEARHLVAPPAQQKLTAFAALTLSVVDFGEDALERMHDLVSRYRDCPMDLADASLVLLADRTSVPSIATIDVSGFATFRSSSRSDSGWSSSDPEEASRPSSPPLARGPAARPAPHACTRATTWRRETTSWGRTFCLFPAAGNG